MAWEMEVLFSHQLNWTSWLTQGSVQSMIEKKKHATSRRETPLVDPKIGPEITRHSSRSNYSSWWSLTSSLQIDTSSGYSALQRVLLSGERWKFRLFFLRVLLHILFRYLALMDKMLKWHAFKAGRRCSMYLKWLLPIPRKYSCYSSHSQYEHHKVHVMEYQPFLSALMTGFPLSQTQVFPWFYVAWCSVMWRLRLLRAAHCWLH
jgi:hypothetical protein